VERRDEASIGTAILGCKEEGFNPYVLVTDLLPTYRTVASYFKTCLHQLCTNHARRDIARIIKDFPAEAKKDKFFLNYMVRIKKDSVPYLKKMREEFKGFFSSTRSFLKKYR